METKAMGEFSKCRAWRKGVTVECTGVGFGARGGSKFRVGRFVRGGGVGNRKVGRDMQNRDVNETGDRTLVRLRCTGWETLDEGK